MEGGCEVGVAIKQDAARGGVGKQRTLVSRGGRPQSFAQALGEQHLSEYIAKVRKSDQNKHLWPVRDVGSVEVGVEQTARTIWRG